LNRFTRASSVALAVGSRPGRPSANLLSARARDIFTHERAAGAAQVEDGDACARVSPIRAPARSRAAANGTNVCG